MSDEEQDKKEEEMQEEAEKKADDKAEDKVEEETRVEETAEEEKVEEKSEAEGTPEEKSEEKKEEKQEEEPEDEYMAMMKQDEADKKAEKEAAEEMPEEDKDIGEELSLIKVKKRKPRKKKEEGSQSSKSSGKSEAAPQTKAEEKSEAEGTSGEPRIYALRTTANREDQVMSFVTSNVTRKKLEVYSVIRPHGMRGYIFLEAGSRSDAEQAAFGVPYARGILPNIIQYNEIEHMLEQVKKEMNIQKNDIAEIISGPFKREKCKITRIDKTKEEVVVELLEAAVPIPITVKMDAVRVIRRDTEEGGDK